MLWTKEQPGVCLNKYSQQINATRTIQVYNKEKYHNI